MSSNHLVERRTDLLVNSCKPGEAPHHIVQMYNDEKFLIESLCQFVGTGLDLDQGIMVIATALHREALLKALADSGHTVNRFQAKSQLQFIDAEQICNRCLAEQDFHLVKEYLEALILDMRGRHSEIRVFGEVVSLLCIQGHPRAAVALEAVWNDLVAQYGLTVLCGYSLHSFEEGSEFKEICKAHSHVLPAEGIIEGEDADSQLRGMAHLQHQANLLKLELARRKTVEMALRKSLRDQQHTAELYQSSEALNTAIVANSNDCIKVLDLDANLLFISPHGLKVLEGCPLPLLGRCWLDYWQDGFRDEIERALAAARAGRIDEMIGFLDTGHAPSSRWWHVVVSPIYNSQGQVCRLLAISRDITEFKKIEHQLRQSIRSRDEFLSIASHELKTPLTSLQMRLEMTKRYLDQTQHVIPEKLEKMMEVCCKQVHRLTSLIGDMLDVSRVQSGKLQLNHAWFDLSQHLREVCESFQDQLVQAGCSIELDICDEVVGQWDQNRIEQVLANLITNAIKYAAGAALQIRLEVLNSEARITVKDSGPGIPQERLPTIFDCFERATSSRSIGGLGLGLFIVKQIVQAHSGRIEVTSQEGHGTSFIVSLPWVEPFSKETTALEKQV